MFKNKISCDYYCLPSQNPETQNIDVKEDKKINKKLTLSPISSPSLSPPPISPPPLSTPPLHRGAPRGACIASSTMPISMWAHRDATTPPPISPPPLSTLPSTSATKQNRLFDDLMKKIEKKIEGKKVEKKKLGVKKKVDQKKKEQKLEINGKKKKTEIIINNKKKERKTDQQGKQKITNRALKRFEKEFLPYHSPSGQNRLKKLKDKKSK